jgi:Ni/Fe-hydrogenase subunit HybB-like protein
MDNNQSEKGFLPFIKDVVTWGFSGSFKYQLYICFLIGTILAGLYAYSYQVEYGLVVTGMSNIVSWGLYISNFTFLVGVAAAAVMLILPAYVFKDKDLDRVVIIGESVAVGALVMCLLFILADLGGISRAWHLIPGIGILNWPSSILAWDVLVLNGYLALNFFIPFYILYCHYHQREAKKKFYRPFVFLSIFWAVAIHMVTAFLYQGLPARPFWNNPLLGPRFLASAFAAGPALITMALVVINASTPFKVQTATFNKLRMIISVSAVINLVMLFSEIFKEFYTPTHHSLSAIYLFFGLKGHNSLVPWIWTAIIMNIGATFVLAMNFVKNKPKFLFLAAMVLFLAIWIEKGVGLIVPGLIPSPLGEVVDYSPTGIEIMVTLGVLALGILVTTLLMKPAIMIEQRYHPG